MRARLAASAAAVALVALTACSDDDGGSLQVSAAADTVTATYEYVIPPGAGEALDAGEPLEILPGELTVFVGETIRIVNEDDRGHAVGPFFVGAGETVSQEFAEPGEFEGVCTVHPSGEIVLIVEESA